MHNHYKHAPPHHVTRVGVEVKNGGQLGILKVPLCEHEGHMGANRSSPQTESKAASQIDAGFESTQTAITSSVDEKP